MNGIKLLNKKITFESFLSGVPARDYIFQNMPYERRFRRRRSCWPRQSMYFWAQAQA